MDAGELASRLPPLRDDEPASLRQEIVDEILDHLQCGLRRELIIQQGNEALAKERTLSRFGDPREVARKLWFQAMWSRIMSQRIVVGSALFSMLVCVALVGAMMWVMQQQQQANAALMERIIQLIPQPAPKEQPLSPEVPRVHLQVKTTLDSKAGPPAPGCSITVSKQLELGQAAATGMISNGSLMFTSDASGLADCGLTEPGRFEVSVRSPTNEYVRATFTISSQGEHIEHIVVPSQIPEMTRVVFHCGDAPEINKDNQIGLVMRLRPRGPRVFAGRSWAPQGRWPNVAMPLVLFGSVPTMTSIEPEDNSNMRWNVPIDEVITHAKWQPNTEWLLPTGDYSVQFGLANLGDKSDARWTMLNNNGNKTTSVWLRATDSFRAEPAILNEWKIELPDYVRMCLRDISRIPEVIDRVGTLDGTMGGGGGGFF